MFNLFGFLKRDSDKKSSDKKCKFFDTCEVKLDDSPICLKGPVYYNGMSFKSYCGRYRTLDNWEEIKR